MDMKDYSEKTELPVDFLEELGVRDDEQGICIPYDYVDGAPGSIRYLNGDKGRWRDGDTQLPYGLWLYGNTKVDELFLTVGESNAQTLWFAGYPALGIPEASSFKSEWTEYMQLAESIYIVPDNDDDGKEVVDKVKRGLRDGGYRRKIVVVKLPNEVNSINHLHILEPDFASFSTFNNIVTELKENAADLEETFAVSLSDFLKEDHKIEWIVDDLIPNGTLTILAAKPKVGKSILTLNLATALCQGHDFLGRKVQKTKILIVQLEDPYSLLQDRLVKMGANSLDKADIDGIYLYRYKPVDTQFWGNLSLFVKDNDIGLVVIDPLIFAKGGNEQEATDMGGFMLQVRDITRKTGTSVFLVHHHRKGKGSQGDEVRGSSAIVGGADVILGLNREGESSNLAKLTILSRYNHVPDEILELNTNTLTWCTRGTVKEHKTQQKNMEILEALDIEDDKTIKELEEILGKKKAAFHKELQQLIGHGFVKRTKLPSSEKGGRPQYIYRLTPVGSRYLKKAAND